MENEFNDTPEQSDFDIESDFNLKEEFKPTPLCQPGTYKGAITEVRLDYASQSIGWTVTLDGNEMFASDGVTPVDGMTFRHISYLPKLADKGILTKGGKQTKYQAKINILANFQEAMEIEFNTKQQIMDGIAGGTWIGLPVKVIISLQSWEGRVFNRTDRMMKDTD